MTESNRLDFQADVQFANPKSLKPYSRNIKNHAKEKVAALAEHIKKYGFDQPILVDSELVIIAGHARREAAIKAGLKQVPYIVRTDLSHEETQARRIQDNLSQVGTLNDDNMRAEMAEIMAKNMSLVHIAINEDQLKPYLPEITPSIPELPQPEPTEENKDRIVKSYNIEYKIVFNSLDEQASWFQFVKWLKQKYPNEKTLAEKLCAHIAETMKE